jgi:3-hydroxybutyryl-CoA dehydrogenase
LSDITRVGVIRCGQIGSGIAEVCARAGLDVIIREVDDAAAVAGRARIEASLARAVVKRPEAILATPPRRCCAG